MKELSILTLLLIGFVAQAQDITIIDDVLSGTPSSYFLNSIVFDGDVYFIGPASSTNSFRAMHKYDGDTEARTKILDQNTVDAAEHLLTNGEAFFITSASFGEKDLYRSDGTAGGTELIGEFGNIDQREIVDAGIVIIDEIAFSNVRNAFFIGNTSNVIHTIFEEINIGFNDFIVSQGGEIVILTPEEDDDFDGGSFFYSTTNNEVLMANQVIGDAPCAVVTQAIGFENYIYYKCETDQFIYNLTTQESRAINLSNADLDHFGETDSHLYFAYEFGRLYAVDKSDLSSELVDDDLAIFPKITILDNEVYYVDNGDIVRYDGENAVRYEYDLGGNDIIDGAHRIDDKLVVLVDRTFGDSDEIVYLNEVSGAPENIINIDKTAAAEYGFHKVNESIIFANRTAEEGLELYKLTNVISSNSWNISNDWTFNSSPNPAIDLLNIDYDGIANLEAYDFQILNSVGQMILEGKLSNDINVASLDQGYYYLQILKDNELRYNSKFIKVRK